MSQIYLLSWFHYLTVLLLISITWYVATHYQVPWTKITYFVGLHGQIRLRSRSFQRRCAPWRRKVGCQWSCHQCLRREGPIQHSLGWASYIIESTGVFTTIEKYVKRRFLRYTSSQIPAGPKVTLRRALKRLLLPRLPKMHRCMFVASISINMTHLTKSWVLSRECFMESLW